MKSFNEHIENYDIYNDTKEKEDVIERCIFDFNQIVAFKNLNVEYCDINYNMSTREDIVKKSIKKKDALKNAHFVKDNYITL